MSRRIYYTLKSIPFVPLFEVQVTIENKPGMSDPEGQTILNDLVLKGSYSTVKKIRSAKMLKFQVSATTKQAAQNTVKKLCDELRIYNPIASRVSFTVSPS